MFRGRWNILTAMTNVVAVYPLYIAYKAGDSGTLSLVGLAATASFLSHLFESHKHAMWGFGTSHKISSILNAIDIVAAIGLTGKIGKMGYNLYSKGDTSYLCKILALYGICNMFLLLSESDYSAATKQRYLICHNIWHIGIFTILGMFLSHYYLL